MIDNSLIFFDKEGNQLNFRYDQTLQRYTGDILFPENSSDTHKTQALYIFERVPAFEFENQTDLSLRKFQLFNEHGFHFYQGADSLKIDRIESVNIESDYQSKWIFATKIESRFKKGTFIRFNQPIFEFTNPNQIYMVVFSKPGAIMIISSMKNNVFHETYSGLYHTVTSGNYTISGVDVIGVYNYVDTDLSDTLSNWNEPTFYDRLYQYRKLNIVNSDKNDTYKKTLRYDDTNVVGITNSNLLDAIHYEYSVSSSSLPTNSTLLIEYISKTDLPLIYQGPLDFDSTGKLLFGFDVPEIIQVPGLEFKVPNSGQNSQTFLRVSSIPKFESIVESTYFATGSQVLFQNSIYECITAYTYSIGSFSTPGADFGDVNIDLPDATVPNPFWTKQITYLPIEPSNSGIIIDESMVGAQIYLTTDRLIFSQSFTASSLVTLSYAFEKYQEELKTLGIDLYLKNLSLKADLMYASDYAAVNFYYDELFATHSIGTKDYVYEKCIEVSERLSQEYNYDYSENYKYNIVFTDLDEFGLIIKINKLVYSERISYVYSSGLIDLERTIDRTLRNWLTRHFLKLNTLGILPSLSTVGFASVYYNCITLNTEYPNVPLEFEVQVGSTANFYIEHSVISIFDIGQYLLLTINGREYLERFDTDIPTTVGNWVNTWSSIVSSFGIFISQVASSLRVDVKRQRQRVSIIVDVGKAGLPGIDTYKVLEKMQGNLGVIITSNEIILGTSSGDNSFEQEGFATGQVISINGTVYPLQNVEYSSLYLNPDVINLSYEGPFWGLTNSICNSSAFTTVAFNIGFGQTACDPGFVVDLTRGMYSEVAYTNAFSIQFQTTNVYNANNLSGLTGMVDLIYVQPVNSIYVLGDYIKIYDSFYAAQTGQIIIPGLTNSISLLFNRVSNYLFALSRNMLYKIDPYINQLIATYSFTQNAHSQVINDNNGDVYVSFTNSPKVNIYQVNSSSATILNLAGNTRDMVYHDFEEDVYVQITDNILRINGDTRALFSTYSVVGATGPMIYDPENEAVYVFGGSNLYKLDNNSTTSLTSISTGAFNNLAFNPYTSTVNTVNDTLNFSSINVDDDVLQFQESVSDYGPIVLNQFDGDLYLAGISGGFILTVDATTGFTKNIEFGGNPITRIIYNPDRKSVWAIRPADSEVLEVEVAISSFFEVETVVATGSNEDLYGSLSSDYINRDYLWLNVREYIRGPRENFNNEPVVSIYFKWYSDNIPQFFMYDFSGDLLPTTGRLAYVGDKPLPNPVLNKKPNLDINKVKDPSAQQTIFDIVEHSLEYVDDNEDFSTTPEPIQLFLGYNSPDEGGLRSVLQMFKKENVDFTIIPTSTNFDTITFNSEVDIITGSLQARIALDEQSTSLFIYDDNGNKRGLKEGQLLAIFIKDVTNNAKQYLSPNNGYLLKIRQVFVREIICDYLKPDVDFLTNESNVVLNYPNIGDTTYLSCRFVVWDKEIGRFIVYGQTEIEDERFRIELNNVGKLVSTDDIYIFKEYDIKEQGVDWNYLNLKRKEMLMVKDMIYPYIGAYKSIINAINYFGYNDLELYEYYRNVDVLSENFDKLFKVEIPDIFDNTVEGWTEKDFINNTFPNDSYIDTNLFNLTYKITDKEGNNILLYTVQEIQTKLQGLKYWLQKNIIPITHKILDITGRADFSGLTTIVHQSRDVQIVKIYQNFTPIIFDLNEAYLLPVNSGSTVYNCVLDFTVRSGLTTSLLPDYYTIDIRTYEIYREWYPFKNYMRGDRVTYYDKLYESVLDNNKTNNPRKFENINDWFFEGVYSVGDIVKYDNRFYIWSGQAGASFSSSVPLLDVGVGANWFEVTEWREIDLHPVDRISEWRPISNLKPFNFTVDSNITPYLVIEVTSDNGYGMIYRDRKNFEIKGILDIQELEAISNLTSKQYRKATLPVDYVNVYKVTNLTITPGSITTQISDQNGNPTWRVYLSSYGEVIYPHIVHEFSYIIGNSSSTDSCSSFRIEMSGDFPNMNSPYALASTGTAYFSGNDLYWNGNLNPQSTMTLSIRAEVTGGGRAYYTSTPNTLNNQAYVPVNYSVIAKMGTGLNYGNFATLNGSINSRQYVLYQRTNSISVANGWPTGPTQSFASGGNGGPVIPGMSWSFSAISISHSSVEIVQTRATFSNNFVDVVDNLNNLLGNFAYVYYQGRVTTTYRTFILFSTYYDVDFETRFTAYRFIPPPQISQQFFSSTNLESSGVYPAGEFLFGTNSTIGTTTITHSYYPS